MSEDRLERIRDRIITMRKRLAEFPWKDWDAGRVAELVDEEEYLISEVKRLRKALEQISEGKGRFSMDHFEHCRNTVEDMKALAVKALAPAPLECPHGMSTQIAKDHGCDECLNEESDNA